MINMGKPEDYSDILFKTKEQAMEFIILHHLKKRRIVNSGDGYRIYFWSDDQLELYNCTGYSINQKDYSYRPYLKIAKELCYPREVLDKIKLTKNEIEVGKIMADARNGRY